TRTSGSVPKAAVWRAQRLSGMLTSMAASSESRALILRAAKIAAAPLRSVPLEAAVGDVLAFLSVDVAINAHLVSRQPELARHELGDARVHALAHFGCARGDLDRAVAVNDDESIGLVQKPSRKRDTELDRSQGETSQESALCDGLRILFRDSLPS